VEVEVRHLLMAVAAGVGDGAEAPLEALGPAHLGHGGEEAACSAALASAAKWSRLM
jgi:hypothetical protein